MIVGGVKMKKRASIILVYQIATLTYPTEEILDLFEPVEYERTLEILLLFRQQFRQVKSPFNYLRRAIEENWNAQTIPQPINRRMQNDTEALLIARGMEPEEAKKVARDTSRKD
jgi:hypothetical protein